MNSLSVGKWVCAACAILVPSALASAATIPIATGPNSGVDGYLSIAPDDYGAWADTTFGGAGDLFNPLGALGLQPAAFTSGFFLFVPNLGQRELLTDNGTWQNVLPADATLDRSITSPLIASDTNGDGIDDTLQSSFRVFGGPTDLGFDLTQSVSAFAPGVSFLSQTYTITNNSNQAVSFSMARVFDGDLVWNGDFSNDEVGTSMHAAGIGTYVFEQEASDPGITAITLSGGGALNYFGGKHGVTPGGGAPAYDYGTDTEVWDAFGIPGSWQNHIAGVGYNTDGVSGVAPPGSTSPQDGFVGLDFLTEGLLPGASVTITMLHTYGQNSPIPGPAAAALLAIAGLAGTRRRRR